MDATGVRYRPDGLPVRERDIGERPARTRGKSRHRNRRRWCGGKPGLPHQPVIVMEPYWASTGWACRETTWVPVRWICRHRSQCESCGRVLSRIVACPDRHA